MKTRSQIQNEIVRKLVKAGGGLALLPTGVGKTRIVIEFLKKISYHRVLIVTSTEKLRDVSWPEEIKKWKGDPNVTIICYQSLQKYVESDFDVVVYDEIHHVTLLNMPFFEKPRKYVLGMTATEPRDTEKKLLIYNVLQLQKVIEMSVAEAVALKLISPFLITKIETRLDESQNNIEAGSKTCKFYTTELANYTYLSDTITRLGLQGKYQMRDIMIRKRLHFMNTLPSKVFAARKFLNQIAPETRTLVFSKSINSAKAISPYCFHSKIGDQHLNEFMNGKINLLSCVNALNEGINIPEIDIAVITQLNSNDLVLTQQLGRVIRFRKDFVGNVYILVAKDTVDENWFQSATKNLSIYETITL